MKNTLSILLVACALGAVLAAAAEPAAPEDNTAEAAAPRNISAVQLNHPTVEWPPGETNREALVFVRLVVSAQGNVSDVVLIEDRGFYNADFVASAKSVARSMRFKPATQDGKPVTQVFVLPVSFGLGALVGSTSKWVLGISDEFRAEAQKVDALFKKGDYAGADAHAQWMLKEKVRYGYEFSVLKATLAQTHASLGDNYRALTLAEDATQRTTEPAKFALHQPVPPNRAANYLLPKGVVVSMLELRMRLAASNGMAKRALEAYYELAGLVEMKPDDPLVVGAAQLTAKLESNDPLVAQGRIDDKNGWSHELYRRHFTLEQIRGGVNELYLSCAGKHEELSYAPAGDWTVPAGWDDCVVSVGGDSETTFSLVELAD